jgi:serine/threonine protein kinase
MRFLAAIRDAFLKAMEAPAAERDADRTVSRSGNDRAGRHGSGVPRLPRRRRVRSFVGGRLFAPEAKRRFIAERRTLALLDHPNIVHMIDGGLWQGQLYLVMEWVAGEPITKYCGCFWDAL